MEKNKIKVSSIDVRSKNLLHKEIKLIFSNEQSVFISTDIDGYEKVNKLISFFPELNKSLNIVGKEISQNNLNSLL